MNGVWLAAATAAAAITLTYFCCIRPMRRGHCTMSAPWLGRRTPAQLDRDLADARAELDALKAHIASPVAAENRNTDSTSPTSGLGVDQPQP